MRKYRPLPRRVRNGSNRPSAVLPVQPGMRGEHQKPGVGATVRMPRTDGSRGKHPNEFPLSKSLSARDEKGRSEERPFHSLAEQGYAEAKAERRAQKPAKPSHAKPASIIAQVGGSGTAPAAVNVPNISTPFSEPKV